MISARVKTEVSRRFSGAMVSLASLSMLLGAFAAAISLSGCVSSQPERRVVSQPVPVPLPPTQVFFYPNSGQSQAQQERDRYECYLWSVKQTGFDPSQPQLASNVRVEVVPMPAPGHDTALGALTGAILGAVVSRQRDAGTGAVIGAIGGAMVGAASDASRVEQAGRVQMRHDRIDAQRASQIERRAYDYRRAMAACLEGRGYTVH